jgi:MFS superfamily sulfate permease-like transporter
MQFNELPRLYRVAKIDLCIWLVAFVSTVVLNVREGLFVSVSFALLTTVLRQQRPLSVLLGLFVSFSKMLLPHLYLMQVVCPARTFTAT